MNMFIYINTFLNHDGIEGPQQTIGYIPCRPENFKGLPIQKPSNFTVIGSSGVTIATGIDLGQNSSESLASFGVSKQTIDKLRPYFGKRKEEAIKALAEKPLTISAAEADELDTCVHRGFYRRYIRPIVKDFEELPPQAQAVIFSLCYQYGVVGVKRRAPLTWKHLMDHNWEAAASELIYGFDRSQYKYRRKMEGHLLTELL